MAKFCGIIGFVTTVETPENSGKYKNVSLEKKYYGDVIRNTIQINPSEYISDSIAFNNDVSILADPYAANHFMDMKYIIFANRKWKIKSVEIKHPRLLLKIGGLYNGV